MTYIRTDNTNFIYKFNDDADYMQYDNIKGHIVKVASTIEELCDEFVVFDKEQPNGKLLYYKGFKNLKNEFINFENDKCKVEIYGAIWTDKGLIYVAKMNEKGCLELL